MRMLGIMQKQKDKTPGSNLQNKIVIDLLLQWSGPAKASCLSIPLQPGM